jgi:hypothetical protein
MEAMSLRKSWSGVFLLLFLIQGLTAVAEPLQFDRYGVIITRRPFGEETLPVPPVDLSKPVLPPDQSFTAKFKIAAVTRNSKGVVQVGLVDLKNNRSTLLEVGDSIEGVEVVEADYVNERARLRRDPEDYWVSMSGGSNHFERVLKDTPAPVSVVNNPVVSPVARVGRAGAPRSSYAARRQSREEARIRQELDRLQAQEAQRIRQSKTNEPPTSVASLRSGKGKPSSSLSVTGQSLLKMLGQSEDSEMSAEEVNTLLQEYQKELIRSGQTPLPIPLTPETDQQLVEEGILPAQE